MSPKAIDKNPKQRSFIKPASDMMRRRRDGSAAADAAVDAGAAERAEAAARADGAAEDGAELAAAGGSPADGVAVATMQNGGDAQIIGQELVPASQALVLRTPDAGKKGQERQNSQSDTPHDPARSSQGAQDRQKKELEVQPSSLGEGDRGNGEIDRPNQDVGQVAAMTTPQGPPMSFAPPSFITPDGQVQGMLPLFSPEQTARLHEIHSCRSWSTRTSGEPGSHGRSVSSVWAKSQ